MTRMLFIILLMLLPSGSRASKTMTLTLDEAPVTQVLQAIAEQQRMNVIIAPGVEGKLSLHLIDVPWKQIFSLVLKLANLSVSKKGNVLQVQSKDELARQKAQEDVFTKQRLLNMPLQQKVYSPRHADVVDLAVSLNAAGEKILGPRGNVTVDKRTNRLVVRGSRQVQKQITEWLREMDAPVGQVELAAHIVIINQEKLRELGVKWAVAEAGIVPGLHDVTTLSSNLAVNAASATAGFNIGRINGRLLELELSALEQQQQLEIIASPRLLVAHRQSASIKQGTEIPYQVSSGKSGATSIEFREAVLGMEVTPTIGRHDNVRLKLRISQNMPGRSIKQADGEVLAIDKQEIETQVEVKNGETLALGGIFQQQNNNSRNSVPFLSDIPWVGQLFHHSGKKR